MVRSALLPTLAALALAGCEASNTYVEPPPAEVTVARPLVRAVTDYLEFTGTTEASGRVEVRARVPGVLRAMHFTPGTEVNEGELLFSIDPAEYEAKLVAAEAEVAAAQASLERAGIELARAERLFEQNAASEAEVVRWRGEQAVARAAVQGAEAAVTRARLDLGYTEIVAPISGRVGRNQVDVGNLVGEGEATVLTDIVDYDPMHAYFNLNERDLLRVMALYRENVEKHDVDPRTDPDSKAKVSIELGLANESGYPHAGVLDFAESGVDPRTGTLRLRGAFPNAEQPARLIPGLFGRIRMPVARREEAMLVSERAIGTDQTGLYVLVVDGSDTVEKRNVMIGQLADGLRVIEDGVGAQDRVVVNGLQRARPGATVAPSEIEMATLATTAMRARATGAETGDAPAGAPDG